MPKPILANDIPTQQGSRQTDTTQIAAIYARVSPTDQADKGYSLPTQVEACQAMALQEGYTVPDAHVFVDDYTGTSLNRPQFIQLRDLVRQRLVQAVFVYDLDRLSRKLAHQLLLNEEFEQAGVALRIVTMPDGTKTPEQQMFANMKGVFAEYERAKILERTERGEYYDPDKNQCRACGHKGDKGGCYVPHPEEAALVQRIFRLYVEGRYSSAMPRCMANTTPRGTRGTGATVVTVVSRAIPLPRRHSRASNGRVPRQSVAVAAPEPVGRRVLVQVLHSANASFKARTSGGRHATQTRRQPGRRGRAASGDS